MRPEELLDGVHDRESFIALALAQLAAVPGETALLAEAALAVDWNRPEEDAAWAYLQPVSTSW